MNRQEFCRAIRPHIIALRKLVAKNPDFDMFRYTSYLAGRLSMDENFNYIDINWDTRPFAVLVEEILIERDRMRVADPDATLSVIPNCSMDLTLDGIQYHLQLDQIESKPEANIDVLINDMFTENTNLI